VVDSKKILALDKQRRTPRETYHCFPRRTGNYTRVEGW
jgi:hypothetical protein